MSIKTYKPTTPARRQMTVSGFDGVDSDFKNVLFDVEVFHGLLGDDRAENDVVCGSHANTSSIFFSAA